MGKMDLPTWDLTPMYKDAAQWEKDFKKIKSLAEAFLTCKGTLASSPKAIRKALECSDAYNRLAEKVYVYAHLKVDEDTTISENQARKSRLQQLFAQLAPCEAWFTPELMAIPQETMKQFLNAPELAADRRRLELVLDRRAHILTEPEERLLGSFGEVLGAASKTFSMLNNADISFGKISDETGAKQELTHGSYSNLLLSPDRNVRRKAFRRMHQKYGELRNTLASILETNVKQHVISAQVRHYPSALEASLSADRISKEVYLHLIESVHHHLPALHRYMDIRCKLLKLNKLDCYDLFVPLQEKVQIKYSWDETVDLAKKALQPMGKEYLSILEKAFAQRWIDVPERKGKRSGAYSSGCFDSYPYILLNFSGNLGDAFTLVHEAGHSLHSYYSRQSQPYPYADYKIFVAEVASTTNEILLAEYLLATTSDPKLKQYLLCHLANEIRTTIFRQTQFAEFEMKIHQAVEEGIPLTADYLDEEYYKLNELYYGFKADKLISHEWARIPHFYYNFYVYKYATGMSAAIQFAQRILHGGPSAREAYFGFLKAGSSKDVLDIMRDAGVDLSTPAPVDAALAFFENVLDEIERS